MANTYDSKGIHGKELLDFGTEIAKKIRTDDEVIAASLNNLNSRLEAFENIENWGDILADSINTSEFPLVAGKPMVVVKAGTPSGTSTIPDYAGQFYVDSTNKVIYCSGGYSSVNDWVDVTNKIGTGTVGTATKPIYLNSGTPTAGSDYAGGTKVTLNGTDKGASTATVYAPTTAGTNNYVLKSNGSGEPSWVEKAPKASAADTATTATDYNTSTGTIKSGLDSKVNIANVNINGQTTTILAQVQAMAASGIHYRRIYTHSDGGSANISDKPVSGSVGFLCEIMCNRYAPTDWRYQLTCWVQEDTNPYVTVVTHNTTTISWSRLNTNTDTKVKATAKTDNVNYKILATASASPTSGGATEAVYDADITLNPSTNTIAANISGDAATASAAKSGSTLATTIAGKQDKLTEQTAYTSKGTATKVPQITTNSLGQVTGITEVTISGVAPSSHTHGNIQDGGTLQTTDVAIASGDKLVITDSSNSNKIARSSTSFDGSTTTTALTPKGTFEAFAKAADITSAINALDATKTSTDGTNVQVKVTEADGKITAVNVTTDTTANVNDSVYYVLGTTDYAQWTANTAYAVNDIVLYSSYARTCKTAHTSGSSFDSSKWNTTPTPVLKGSIPGITSLYVGLKIAYKWPCYGGQSSTYLNINGLGNVYIRRNDSNITTHLPPNAVNFMAYDGTYWRWADYNSDAWVTSMGGYCATAAGTAAKSADSTNTVLTAGMAMLIRFTQTNSAASKLTLNVNDQGAKDLWINGKVSSATNYTLPAGEHWCFYDGTNWYVWTDGTVQFKTVLADSYKGLEYTNGENLVRQYITSPSTSASVADDHKSVTITPTNNDTYFYVALVGGDIGAFETVSASFDVIYDGADDGNWNIVWSFANSYTNNVRVRGTGHYTITCVPPAAGWNSGNGWTAPTNILFLNDSTKTTQPANTYTFTNLKIERGATATGFCLSSKENQAGKLATARELAVSLSNTSTTTTFDGSANVTNIKVSGTLPVANGGTGKTTARDAANLFINGLDTGSSTPVDADYYVSQYVGGGTTTTTYYRRPMSALWSYVKGKMSSDTGVNISGNAATATSATTATSAGKLTTARKTYVTLGTASTATTRDWSGDTTIPVDGQLKVANGGTGSSTAAGARTNLDVYSKSEVDTLMSGRVEFVTALPATGSAGVTYYVGPTGTGADQYDEYIWNGTQFVKVGEHSIDLANYVNTLSTSGTGSVLTNLTKSGNTLTVTKGNISLDNLSNWASKTDVTISSTTYHTYWPTAPSGSGTVYGISITGGKLYRITYNNGSYSAYCYDTDTNTTYTQEKLGQGYGTCTTEAATAAKTATLADYVLLKNGIVAIKFSNALCASATLNINGNGAKPIYIHGSAVTSTSATEVKAGDIALFIYDGTSYNFLCTDGITKNAITGLSVSGTTVTYTRNDGTTGSITTKDTTYSFDGDYDASTNKAATVKTVTNKIAALDVSDISGFGAGKTLATLTETDGKIAATFQDISITKSQVSDFSHAHGNITNAGAIGSTSGQAVYTTDNGVLTAGSLATTDPTASGTTTTAIATISQDAKGKITVTKKTISGVTPASHTHGNIQNDGTLQTDDVTIASGDKLVITDSSNSSKAARASVSFDGSTTTTALTPKGTFESFAKSSDITSAINALDVSTAGGDGKYIKAISETDGKISATVETMDTTPTASSTKAVTSGGVKTALDVKANLASPALTGTPTAPTATAGTNTTQIATTAFVQNSIPTAITASDINDIWSF